jgi:HlyD family secretion protein
MAQRKAARFVILGIVVIGALVAIALYAYERSRKEPLVLSGTIEAHNVQVGSLVGGRVLQVAVEEGDRVRPGQLIATLETANVDHQIAEQEAAIQAARAQLQKTMEGPRREEVERAAIVYENAERERRRLADLLQSGVIPRQQYDNVATMAATAAKELEILRRGSRTEDVATSRAQLEREVKRLETLRENRSEARVTASVAGVIQSVSVRPGDLVNPSQGVAEIVEDGQLWVRVYVPEPLLGSVQIGMLASIRVDTFPDRTFEGKVIQINEEAEYTPRNIQTRAQRGELVFGVKVQVAKDEALKPGMAADIELKGVTE